jgi:hypothetical protein
MRRDEEIEKLIAQVRYRSNTPVRARIRRHLDDLWQHRRPVKTGRYTQSTFGGSTMTRWSQAAVIALAIIALAGLVSLLNKSAGPAYALEQTIDAVKDIRYFHFQYLAGSDEPLKEAWIEYDPNNSVRNVRVNFYGGRIGTRAATVWSPDATQYWQPDANDLFIYDDKEYTDKVLFFVRRYDPKQAIPYLQERARHGGIQIDIGQPDNNTDPILVTVTYDPNTYMIDKPKPRMRELFSIDPSTKLITQVETETFLEGRFLCDGVYHYVDYNRPFDPRVFDLRNEVPPDANVSDTTGILMGVEQGRLSDEEIAVKVVREFLEAWASKDYDLAVQIHGYVALGETKGIREKLLLQKNILRVISVGPPVLPERPMSGLLVPCEVEYEENGQTKSGALEFRTSEGPRGRWRIRGPQTMGS